MRILIAATLLTAYPLASAQSLWDGTAYGMSAEQVKKLIPNVTIPKNPSNLGDGAQELLRLENIEIVNNKFSASFYFISE